MKNSNPFIGTWRLVSWQNTDAKGAITYPCGTRPIGYLLYTGDGYMAAQVMNPDLHHQNALFPRKQELLETHPGKGQRNVHVTYLSYCGTYSYSIEGAMLTHCVKVSSITEWIGKDQLRHFEFNGANLFLSHKGAKIIWERAVGHE